MIPKQLAIAPFILLLAMQLFAAEPAAQPWSEYLPASLKSAQDDGKPVLAVIRNAQDVGTLDVCEWLRDDSARKTIDQFHVVALWNGNAALKEMKIAMPSGLLFLTPKSEPIAIEEVPLLRADFKPLLEKVLALPKPMEESARPAIDEKGRPNQAMQRRMLRGLPDDLKSQVMEMMKCARAQNDGKATARGTELVETLLARSMSREECLRCAGPLQMSIAELDVAGAGEHLAKKIQQEAPVGRIAADAFLDLAELAFTQGKRDEAAKLFKDAEKASEKGESPTMFHSVRAFKALCDDKSGPNHSKWAKREVLDVVVLVSDMRSFAKAISRWDEKTFFPVLFNDDIYAPKFIAAFKPAQVVLAPAENGDLNADDLRRALAKGWGKGNKGDAAEAVTEDDLRKKLETPGGIVITDGTSGETAGALALAAGRFEALEIVPAPKIGDKVAIIDQHLSKSAAWDFTKEINARMAKWGLPKRDEGWSYITLAGTYPFRYSGDNDGYGFGTTYALDDLVGRDENTTRHSVVGRLLGDNARSAYQAMCSLFLQPENVFLFNTYGLNPKSIWGAYRMDFSDDAFKNRFALTHLKGEGANIETFREHEFPWNRDNLITINSSGGWTEWSVGGGGGTADDFPVGAPCAIHVTHSGSAGDPYNPDTLAGRAVWGGAFFYFGSTAEPFLTSFQPPSLYAPLIANGAPLAAAFRKRTGQYFGWPWRLMIVGDPQFALRSEPAKRKDAPKNLISDNDQSFFTRHSYYSKHHIPTAADAVSPLAPFRKADEALHELRMLDDSHGALNFAMKLDFKPYLEKLDGGCLAMGLEELIIARANDVAINLWKAAPEEARKTYAARVYARQAAGALLDKAQAAEDFAALQKWMDALLSTSPAGNFVERWMDKILAVAEKKKEDAGPWLLARMGDEKLAAFRGSFSKRLAGARLKALSGKEKWTAEDKAVALSGFSDAVKAKVETDLLVKQYEEFQTLCVAKLAGTSADSIAADVKALFKADSDEGKRVESVFAQIATRKTFFKDWLLLGPFKDEEKLDPAKLDFAASFTDHGQKIEWKRPFNEAAFGTIDLITLMNPHDNVHCYAAAEIDVEKDIDGVLLLGSDDGIVAWLDGKEIHRNPAQRGVQPDQDSVNVKLSAGKHSILLRIDQGGGGWGFCARLATPAKQPLGGVTWKCPK